MAPERWAKVKQVLGECLELPPGERPAYLDNACAGDQELRREVESLTESYEAADDLLEEPAMGRCESPEAMEGRRVGPYRVVREIGEGGMARVYLAVRADDAFRRQVAIKLVKRGMDFDFILRRFRHERQIMASLEHPNIARLFDGGTCDDGTPYFVMEYIQGRPIDEHCDANRLTISGRLELFRTVCSAVQHAHEHGIVHRDIKPGNILITPAGVPKLLDFGIAKVLHPEDWTGGSLTRTATIMRLMTPEYASPEQVRGDEVTAATDVYSLGILLYELLTGHKPYRIASRAPHEMAKAICESEPQRPSTAVGRVEAVTRTPFDEAPRRLTPERVSETRRTRPDKLRRTLRGDLDNIVLTAMRKEPARRYRSAAELSEDIRRYTSGLTVRAQADTLAYRARKLLQRHRTAAAAYAAGVVLALALGVAALKWFPAREGALHAAPAIRPFTTLQGSEKQPVFSPDGRQLAFVWGGERDENDDIYIKPLEGGEMQRVTTDAAEDLSPVWSPDGRWIAWLRIKDDKIRRETGVFVARVSGGVHRKVADVSPNRVEAVGRHLDWSRDGSWLAVADRTTPEAPFAIYRVGVASGEKQRLISPPAGSIGDTSPAFSPDGRNIAFLRSPSSGISELYVAPLADGEARRLTFDNRVILSQTWTADGKSLIFSSNRTGGFCLWQIAATGGTPRRIPGTGEGASEPAMSRDGRHLAYSQFMLDANIWRYDLATGGEPRMLISSTQYDSSPQYSPDGQQIAFRSLRSGFNEIWLTDADGRRARQLTHFGGPLTGTPRWSPDGRWIAFDSRPEGQADIFVIPSEGGTPRRMTFDTAEDVVPNWSRDGKWLYWASNRGGSFQVWKVPAAGGLPVQVTDTGGFAPAESPDGRWLYYARGRGVAGLYRRPASGGPEEPVLERLKPGFWGHWAVAPNGVYFADLAPGVGGDLFYLRLRDRAVEHLAYVDKPFINADSMMALSPDGRSLLYTQVDQSGSDIMLADMSGR